MPYQLKSISQSYNLDKYSSGILLSPSQGRGLVVHSIYIAIRRIHDTSGRRELSSSFIELTDNLPTTLMSIPLTEQEQTFTIGTPGYGSVLFALETGRQLWIQLKTNFSVYVDVDVSVAYAEIDSEARRELDAVVEAAVKDSISGRMKGFLENIG